MRILVLDTGRGIGAAKVELWAEHLGLTADDQLDLVSWFPPKELLPLRRHLVCGPVLRLGHEPVDWAVAAPRAQPDHAATTTELESTALGPSEPTTEQDADEAYVEAADRGSATDTAQATHPGPTRPAASTASLPVYHPQRVRQAVRWRARKGLRRASRLSSPVRRSAQRHVTTVRGLPDRAARSLLRRHDGDGIAGGYIASTFRSREVHELFRQADVVLPVDARSQKAAWLLARRHAGPDVLVTLPSARRALEARR